MSKMIPTGNATVRVPMTAMEELVYPELTDAERRKKREANRATYATDDRNKFHPATAEEERWKLLSGPKKQGGRSRRNRRSRRTKRSRRARRTKRR